MRPDLVSSQAHAAETVFVLDADPAFRRDLAHVLSRAGFCAVLFRSARELLTALQSLRPSMIVADPVVPDMSGVNLLVTLRRDRCSRDIPLVIMTAANDAALPLRVDATVVYKPDVGALAATIRSMLHPATQMSTIERQ